MLVHRLIRAAYKYGGDSITLEVRKSNLTALTLYKSLGFEEEGRTEGLLSGYGRGRHHHVEAGASDGKPVEG